MKWIRIFKINKTAKIIALGILLIFCAGNKAESQIVDCTKVRTDDREIRIKNPGDIVIKRGEIIRAIWNEDHIPDRSNVIITSGVPNPLHPDPNLRRVDKIEIPVPDLDSLKDLAYYFIPVHRKKILVIYNPGHSCTLKDDERHLNRNEATIRGLLGSGYDVLAVFMPHVKESADGNCRFDHCAVMNSFSNYQGLLPTSGLRFFLDPTIVSLNHLLKKYRYKSVNMVGLSGGGWTTNLVSAVDPRIKYSFNVAGSIPVYYRSGSSIGDIEQFLPPLYRDIAGYPDLYVLGSFGKDRKQVQILNRKDDCCFGEKQHDPLRNYDADMQLFAQSVAARLAILGQMGHYRFLIDDTAPNHQISEFALKNVILPALEERKNNGKQFY